ncbi:RAB7A-interacting MON1-CCZ1 complex subunit 1-like [Liolophura sinensis]|uniref:RAB7A-interacting MON1-CCZ1 complex subunit 1-like n=1 Tax=Liolophura sinensis TaxID=3198878 RepID=UPI0031584D50
MASCALDIVAEALKTLEEKCSVLLQTDKGNELLISSKVACQKLLQQINSKDTVTLTDCLQGYAQASLDFTYVDENLLVEEEFSQSSSDERIRKVFDQFDNVIKLATELTPSQNLVDVLTPDLYECILWRKGALLYMYCSCVEKDETRAQSSEFMENLQKGVGFLQEMLKVRIPLTESREEIEFNDIETLQLLQSGLFSDVHVLALMYCGEMCFWYHTYAKSATATDFDAKSTGVKLLRDYINAVKGPLSGKGWNCDRAEQLLKVLQDT